MTYKCGICGYETIYPQNYKRHMKSHMKSGEISDINNVKSNEINAKSVKSLKSQDHYLPVYTAESEITPVEEDHTIDNDLQIIGETINKVNKSSSDAIKHYKPKETEKTDASSGNGLAIALIAIVATIVIVWMLFGDRIMNMLNGGIGNVPAFSLDGT